MLAKTNTCQQQTSQVAAAVQMRVCVHVSLAFESQNLVQGMTSRLFDQLRKPDSSSQVLVEAVSMHRAFEAAELRYAPTVHRICPLSVPYAS